jgi:peptidoglycan/xylan/chitin deacetylase (PgdA/CDA1 family)
MDTRRVEAIRDGATFLDQRAAVLGLRFEGHDLISFLFHHLFADEAEIARDVVHPQEGVTLAGFRRFVEHFLDAGYTFVTPADVVCGLAPDGRYACVTFDDGYADNRRALDLLREYGVPATLFASANHVAEGRRFWWDAVYAERRRRGAGEAAIEAEIAALKGRRHDDIERHVTEQFGARALVPLEDLDRPLTPQELRALASDERVMLGNHTLDHAILTVLDRADAEVQLAGARRALEGMAHVPVRSVSYPNGDHDPSIVDLARALGHDSGMTTVRRKEPVATLAARRFELGRFQFERRTDLEAQMRAIRSGLHLADAIRRVRARRSAR